MADEAEVIRIDLASDVSEGEAAKQVLAGIEKQVEEIAPAFERAREANGRFVSTLTDAASLTKAESGSGPNSIAMTAASLSVAS